MKLNKLLIAILSLSLISCAAEEEVDTTIETEIEEPTSFEKDEALEGLKLNQGNKWKVNHETEVGIQNINALLTNFEGDDLKQLGKDIKAELSTIIKLCTMKGEDHDQFHIVLHAMMKESKRLKKGKSDNTDKMKRYVEVYYAHFEE